MSKQLENPTFILALAEWTKRMVALPEPEFVELVKAMEADLAISNESGAHDTETR